MEDVLFIETKLTRALDEGLKEAREAKSTKVRVINGRTGFGATAGITAWLKHHNLNYYRIDAPSLFITTQEVEYADWNALSRGQTFSLVDKIEPPIVKKNIDLIFSSDQIDKLDEPDKVIFIDDYDWANYPVRKHLQKLIAKSAVRDIREEDNNYTKILNNILLIIVRVHPDRESGDPYDEWEEKWFGKQMDFRNK